MFFRTHTKLGIWISSMVVLLTVFCVSISIGRLPEADTNVNLRIPDNQESYDAYKAISYAAMRAYLIHLTDPRDTEELEKLVKMSDDFIKAYPSSERVDKIYFYLGKALVKLGRVENGIAALERLVQITPPDYVPKTRFPAAIGDTFKWRSLERGLLELGLAYDKQKAHDKADAVYIKLIIHPEFAGGMQAAIARQVLELDTVSRTGEVPKRHNGWIGQTTPNFEIEKEDEPWKQYDFHHYRGNVVLLYYGIDEADTQSLTLKVIYSKFKDKRFQLITANTDISETHISKPIVRKRDAWIQYYDLYGILASIYQIRTLPAVFLMDANGIVRKTDIEEASLEKAVKELVTANNAIYDNPRTQAIVAKAVEAHGGLEKLKTVENFVNNFHSFQRHPDGSIDNEINGKAYHTRDKLRMDLTRKAGVQLSRIFDGTAIYDQQIDGTYKQMADIDARYMLDYYKDTTFREPIWLLTTLAQNDIPIQYVGTDTVNDEPAAVLRVRQPSGTTLKIFISEKTGYILQLEQERGNINSLTSFEQYMDVTGINISRHWIDKHHYHIETVLNKISFNADIDPELFKPISRR